MPIPATYSAIADLFSSGAISNASAYEVACCDACDTCFPPELNPSQYTPSEFISLSLIDSVSFSERDFISSASSVLFNSSAALAIVSKALFESIFTVVLAPLLVPLQSYPKRPTAGQSTIPY